MSRKKPSEGGRKPAAKPKAARKKAALPETSAEPQPAAAPAVAKPAMVDVTAAKGRPMLHWVGKRPLSRVTAFPAQRVERHDALRIVGINPDDIDAHDDKMQLFRDLRGECNEECWKNAPFINGVWTPEVGGLLLHGDNKDVLAFLLANGYRRKVDLIYIDPPFDSGADYVRRVGLRGARGSVKLEGETYSLGEQLQYPDIWANDNYLQFMYERLLLLKELLANSGTLFLHCDWHRNHLLRCLLDEVLGADNFRSQIVREKCNPKNYTSAGFGNIHDLLLMYSKGDTPTWNRQFERRTENDVIADFPKVNDAGRRFTTAPLHAPGVRSGETGKPWRNILPPPGNHWRYVHSTLDDLDAAELIEWSESGNPRKIIYADESQGLSAQDIWLGMKDNGGPYPTEKNEAVLERILQAASNPGDLVLDCFLGSGTTAAVAQNLGRRWIGCDINKGAIQTTVKRLRGIVAEQIAEARKRAADARQGALIETDDEQSAPPKPCAFGFTVWRVNDYDLQIQHNEAVNLACEHIGVERTRSDGYFDGTLGKRLVKIIPFGHPLTPLDLEELKRELDSRPDEDRGIVVVCLGMELAAQAWLDDWNRLRKGKGTVNRIEAIELRTDPKYGRFIKHEPAGAKVKIARKKRGEETRIVVEIQDFISPTIVERLRDQSGVLTPKIDDWRAMVDCIYIDTAYDSAVLNVAMADVPERKSDLVEGKYELPAPDGETTVAIKIIDMLGEEVLVTQTV
ncbi:MAG: site-specific DNA-methyltransferase [Planctomycetaceae bacterium]